MFCLDVIRDPSGTVLIVILAHYFTNPYDAYLLLGQVFWSGCEFIVFTTYIFTDFKAIYPAQNQMHTLPYQYDEDDEELTRGRPVVNRPKWW
jgi:hypothetical protein